MPIPVFVDVEPPPGCGCEGCARRRLAESVARDTGGPAATGAARVVVMAAAVSAVLAAPVPAGATGFTTGRAAPADPPADPAAAPPATLPAAPMPLTRSQILERAETWVAAEVPYSMTAHWKDGYRQDCSGYVSMAWGLNTSAWTGDLADYGVPITKEELAPGDILLFHNAAAPASGSHTVVFGGWADDSRTEYTAYEQSRPATRVRTTPYAYWSHSSKYVPYRYRYLTDEDGPAARSGTPAAAFPGRSAFGPGAVGSGVTRLGTLLVGRGAGTYYKVGPGPRWSRADRDATAAFQRAQGWTGGGADGLPGPTTWRYLVNGLGHDVDAASPVPPYDSAPGPPPYPGAGAFRPGRSHDAVLSLGRRLVAKGFGGHYRLGPTPTWSEADRRNVEAFQRAQGWSGRDADGRPGPETWRRLFS